MDAKSTYKRNSELCWADLNKDTFLLLKESVYLPKDKNEDWLFSEMIEQSTLDEEGYKIQLELQGLKLVCHARLCNVLLKRFPQKTKMRNIPDIDMKIENIPIPYNPIGKGLVVPPLRIIVKSLANSIQLSLTGESSLIFVLYHLQKIIQSFLTQLPINIDECYTFPSQSSNASDYKNNEKLDDADKNTQEDVDVTSDQISPSSLLSGQSSPIIWTQRSKLKMKKHDNDLKDQHQHKTTEGEKDDNIAEEQDNCPECVLINIAKNITVLVSTNGIQVNMECNASCLTVKDSMETIVDAFFNLVVDLKNLKVSTMLDFKKNFHCLSKNVLNKAGGSYNFYCLVLDKFMA